MGKHRDKAIASLRSLIVTGELAPDEVFSEKEIAERFGVSRTPVREAIAMLDGEGLLDQIPQVGVSVHVFSEAEIDDLLKTRHIFETHIAGKLAERPASVVDVAALTDLVERMEVAATTHDRLNFLEADASFHTEIARRADYALAAELIERISDKIRIVGLGALFREDGMEEVIAEHRAILKAIDVHDGAEAAEAMDDHLTLTRKRLERNRLERN